MAGKGKTIRDFVESGYADLERTIDGEALYRNTIGDLNTQNAAAGCGIMAFILGSGVVSAGIIPFAVVLFALVYIGGGGLVIGYLVVVLGGAALVWVLLSGTRESQKVLRDPAEVTAEQIMLMGAREPIGEEIVRLVNELRRIQNRTSEDIQAPDGWRVFNRPFPSSFTLGDVIFISRPMINSSYLGAALAYELARLQQGDGRMRLALNQLSAQDDKENFPYQSEWVEYWRQQVFKADEFVAHLGLAGELIEYLRQFEMTEGATPYLYQEEPYKAERIERLRYWATKY